MQTHKWQLHRIVSVGRGKFCGEESLQITRETYEYKKLGVFR